MISGSQKRLKRKGSIACGVSGPPSWKSTTPTRRIGLAIPRVSLQKEDVTQNLYAASMKSCGRQWFGLHKLSRKAVTPCHPERRDCFASRSNPGVEGPLLFHRRFRESARTLPEAYKKAGSAHRGPSTPLLVREAN